MSRYKVEISNVNTANIKVLKQKEMEELFIKMHNGDMLAKDELINGNLKLVLSILKKYNHYIDNMDDLFQVGCIGLIKAIDNFDLSHQVKFSTYAVPMILGEIKRYLRDNTSLRISRSVKDLNLQILKKKEELGTWKAVAGYYGVTEQTLRNKRVEWEKQKNPKNLNDNVNVNVNDNVNEKENEKKDFSYLYDEVGCDGYVRKKKKWLDAICWNFRAMSAQERIEYIETLDFSHEEAEYIVNDILEI